MGKGRFRILEAVWVVLGGMAIVFACLGVLLLIMSGIKRAFKPGEGEDTKK